MTSKTEKIRALNDKFRTRFVGGTIFITQGVEQLSDDCKRRILKAVRDYTAFDEDNDPYGEHDFGSIDDRSAGKVFWKIDCYDASMEMGSEDPSNPDITKRVLTVLLANEY